METSLSGCVEVCVESVGRVENSVQICRLRTRIHCDKSELLHASHQLTLYPPGWCGADPHCLSRSQAAGSCRIKVFNAFWRAAFSWSLTEAVALCFHFPCFQVAWVCLSFMYFFLTSFSWTNVLPLLWWWEQVNAVVQVFQGHTQLLWEAAGILWCKRQKWASCNTKPRMHKAERRSVFL